MAHSGLLSSIKTFISYGNITENYPFFLLAPQQRWQLILVSASSLDWSRWQLSVEYAVFAILSQSMFNFFPKQLREEGKMSLPLPPGHIQMKEWNIIIIEHYGDIIEKFLGLDSNTGRYRISSQILSYEPETNTGCTLSGSGYQFADKPGKLHVSAQDIYDKLFNAPEVKVSLKFPYHDV